MAGGAYAQFLFVPGVIARNNLHILPETLSFEEAALAEPLACALYAVEDVPIRLGDTVATFGGGAIGQMFIILCKSRGAARENGADIGIQITENPDYLEAVRGANSGYSPDITIDATGTTGGWLDAINSVRRAGTVMLFGGCKSGSSIELDTRRMHYDCLSLKSPSVYHQNPDLLKRCLKLLDTRVVNGKALITERVPLQDAFQALERIIAGEGLKFAVIPPGL